MNDNGLFKRGQRKSGLEGSRAVTLGGLVVLLLGLSSSMATAQQAGQGAEERPAPTGPRPILKVDSPTHDFGTTWIDEKLEHAFKISNVGDAPLEIRQISAGCRPCSRIGEYPRRLDPGESGEIPLEMVTSRLRGRYSRSLRIHTNDPVSPVTTLTLTGECKWYINVEPSVVSFRAITDQQPHESTVTLTNNTDQPMKVTLDSAASSTDFKLELAETKPGQEYQLKVSTVPPYKRSVLRAEALLNTDIQAQKTISIPISARVPPRLEVVPSTILLRDVAPQPGREGRSVSRMIRFTNHGEQPVRLLETTTDDADLELTVIPQTAGKSYLVRVQMPQGYQPPPEGRIITLRTDDQEQPTLTVPVRGVTRRSPRATPQALIGRPAPSFTLQTTEGRTVDNAKLSGAIAVLNLVPFNDSSGQQQLGVIEKLRPTYEGRGVLFLHVHQTNGEEKIDAQELTDLAEEAEVEGEIVHDVDNRISRLFHVSQYPTTIVLGPDGQVKAVNEETTHLDFVLQVQLNSLLADMPIPNMAPLLAAAQRPTPRQAPPRPALELKGKPAPEFALKTLDDKDVSNKDLAEHAATVLNFVAMDCGFCRRQIPQVEKLRQVYEAKGVRFVNMVQTMRRKYSAEELTKAMDDLESKLELAVDENNSTGRGKFMVRGYPTLFVVGREGVVQEVIIGARADLAETLDKQLEALTGKAGGG